MADAIERDDLDRRDFILSAPRVAVSQSPDSGSSFSNALTPPGGAEAIRDGLRGKYVCPFCGSVNDSEQGMCPRCTMENSAATRKATKTRIGPWYVLQTRNPAAPGMTWETLLSFIRKGRVKPRSIVRGPTTHQLWRFAAQVKGLSREFAICYSCGSNIETNASLCPTCNRMQEPPPNPDALLEASRDAQLPNYGTPPATIDGNVLAASGPATIVGQLMPGSLAASAPAVVAPPVNEGDFVIPALGSGQTPGRGAAAASGLAAGTNVAPPYTPGPATPIPVVPQPAAAAPTPAPARNRGVPAQKPTTEVAPEPYSGISGDASWAKIPETPRDRVQPKPERPRPAPRGPATAAPNAGQAFNPYADDDAPGRRNEGDGGFLSAKDLAAAFNLGFVGEDDEAPVQRTVRQPAANPAASRNPTAGAMGVPGGVPGYPAPARSRFRGLKIFLLLLMLAAAGFGVAVAVNPELFDTTKAWVKKQIDNLSKQTEADKLGDQPRKTSNQPKPAATRPTDDIVRPGVTNPGVPNPGLSNPGITGERPTATPGTTPPAGLGVTPAQKVFSEAMDLEDTDPAKALEKYKRMKVEYPREEWPALLETAIKRVEGKLGVRPPG